MRRWLIGIATALAISTFAASLGQAATAYADPAFHSQWDTGEAIAPNFWGPLATAHDGQQEQYKEASGGNRLVQYFDKGRMELTNGAVTNGLLATELVTGRVQLGDNTFENRPPTTVAIAGDPSNTGPTYPMAAKAENTLYTAGPGEPTYPRAINRLMRATGELVPFDRVANYPDVQIESSDSPTVRPVANVFATYRDQVSLATVGYAITAPFWVNVAIGGVTKDVMVQAFERRVLTYTPSNPLAFRVEMGNIGQHYYQWRYPNGTSSSSPGPIAPIAANPPSVPTPISLPIASPTASSTVLSVAFTNLTSPIAAGSTAAATIQTAPNASCSITVTAKSGQAITKGLDPKVADSVGRAFWTWTISSSATPGIWPVSVTCTANGQAATKQAMLSVT